MIACSLYGAVWDLQVGLPLEQASTREASEANTVPSHCGVISNGKYLLSVGKCTATLDTLFLRPSF